LILSGFKTQNHSDSIVVVLCFVGFWIKLKLMIKEKIKKVHIFTDEYNPDAKKWSEKTEEWLRINRPEISFDKENPDLVVSLGGDGTIISASTEYMDKAVLIAGFNLGLVGFLATVRGEENFITSLERIFEGDFDVLERMTLEIFVKRDEKVVYQVKALNDLVIENLLGVVELGVYLEGFNMQNIRGTGIVVSTPTGSTAFNMSAHGPIIMPNIKCMILTELMDHNVPTPPVVIKHDSQVEIVVNHFRERDWFKTTFDNETANVVLTVDGKQPFVLNVGDRIKVTRAEKLAKFIELEKNYFFKSLQEKFSFE